MSLIALVVVACDSQGLTGGTEDGRSRPSADDAALVDAARAPARPSTEMAAVAQAREPMLVRRAQVGLEVADVDTTAAALRALAERLDGRVEHFQHRGGRDQVRSATATLRVPEPRLDEALSRIQELGEVEGLTVSEQEVTEEVQDLEIRLRNQRRLEDRLLRLLQDATGELEQVLRVERELARVRQEVESYEARLRTLERDAAWSRVSVSFHERYPVAERPTRGILTRLARAFLQAGDNLMTVIAVGIAGLGYVVPLGVLAGGIVWLVRRLRTAKSEYNSELANSEYRIPNTE